MVKVDSTLILSQVMIILDWRSDVMQYLFYQSKQRVPNPNSLYISRSLRPYCYLVLHKIDQSPVFTQFNLILSHINQRKKILTSEWLTSCMLMISDLAFLLQKHSAAAVKMKISHSTCNILQRASWSFYGSYPYIIRIKDIKEECRYNPVFNMMKT